MGAKTTTQNGIALKQWARWLQGFGRTEFASLPLGSQCICGLNTFKNLHRSRLNQPSDAYFCHPETETHPKPSSKRVENVSFATLVGHLKGGVHDRPFKQHLTSAFSAKPFKQHPRAWVGEGGTSLRIPETAAHPKPS